MKALRVMFWLSCFTSMLAIGDSPRLLQPQRIDLIRKTEAGDRHVALRCSKGTVGDKTTQCEIRKQLGSQVISSQKVSLPWVRKQLDTFFEAVPDRFIASDATPFHRDRASALNWRVSDGKKMNQGSFAVGIPREEQKSRESIYAAILLLEMQLDLAIAAPH